MRKLLLILALACSFNLFGQSIDTAAVRSAIARQMATYPESTLQDIYKSFYQEHFGPGHIISDTTSAQRYLIRELSEMGETTSPFFEPTGSHGDYIRIYLSTLAKGLITTKQLLDVLVKSANSWQEPSVSWTEKWGVIVSVIQANNMEIEGFEADLPLLNEAAQNNQAVHHSRRYNEAYHPHYRIVERGIFEHQLLGFFGNHPFLTRSRCLKSSEMYQKDEKATTPSIVDGIMAFTKSDAATQPRPTNKKAHQHPTPK